ncbi:hypothetical protein WN55_02818 [Dufourea novaeangliae]|uniref:Uncharacterized protein n=1 Tax=Dufourea novaeangliae TaxID=178035 RepID=A0A154PI39_DUFNO|nr:hypothetical protein WN55_02818 [Dufourea novaeangliae]
MQEDVRDVDERGEEAKRRDRLINAERFRLERRNSTGGIEEEMLRKKRHRQNEERSQEEEKDMIFGTSKKIDDKPRRCGQESNWGKNAEAGTWITRSSADSTNSQQHDASPQPHQFQALNQSHIATQG